MSRRIPSLDGVRGVCIGLVLLGHVQGTAGFPFHGEPIRLGRLGVTTFFVLSGYLVTRLLLEERARTGGVALSAFYRRRAIRLFPALYAFVAAVVLLEIVGVVELGGGDVLTAATHTMNFHARRAWWLGHTWSLSFQGQFYLLWAPVLAVLGAAGGRRVALGAVAAAPLLRVAVFYGWPEQRALVDQAFPLIFDGPATGCLLAFLREDLWRDARYRRLLESPFFAAVPLIVLVTHLYRPSVAASLLVGQTVINVCIAACLDWAMRFSESRVGRVLACRPLTWVGTLSYSLYLWQQIFLARDHPAWFTTFPLNLLLAFAAATVSYHLTERPFARLRAPSTGPPPLPAGAPSTTERT